MSERYACQCQSFNAHPMKGRIEAVLITLYARSFYEIDIIRHGLRESQYYSSDFLLSSLHLLRITITRVSILSNIFLQRHITKQ